MNTDHLAAAERAQRNAHTLGDHTPVEQILATMSDQYALFAACAAMVEAVAFQRGVHCDCPGSHVIDCPVAESIELIRRMRSLQRSL